MWQNFIDVTKSAAAFLQNGVAPPNASDEAKKIMEDANHFASKKFFIVFTAALLLAFFYFASVGVLILMPKMPEVVTGFVTMFTKTIEVLAVIIAFYTTGQAVVDLRYNSSSNAGLQGESITENITETLTQNAKEDDYTLEVDSK